ncbi:hypothetical protein IFT48_05180 [Pseudomonas fluorescens]|uniref:hypothetical protein n=1 Tax=Pseudomonas TaxID=286 RepID=UPI0013CE6BA0|nr:MULTISPECIES: hypothetical protein [Pseudomonas]MBD8089369.1 hypothetical protein [Pseudomonas fluorescens]MBD8615204.1 hypothetical protein [Pseudomonas putida]MBD8682142.1 hypothetical protein [Pseudomonas sp. CFBP 13719]
MSEKSNQSPRGRGRPRLQAEPCTIRIGLPLTESDHRALQTLVERDKIAHGKRSKQEVIRELIRVNAASTGADGE